jgi:hypothetical protein
MTRTTIHHDDDDPNVQYRKCQALVQQGVCHTVALPFTLKGILTQKKNYGNSNISKKSAKKKPKSFKISEL